MSHMPALVIRSTHLVAGNNLSQFSAQALSGIGELKDVDLAALRTMDQLLAVENKSAKLPTTDVSGITLSRPAPRTSQDIEPGGRC